MKCWYIIFIILHGIYAGAQEPPPVTQQQMEQLAESEEVETVDDDNLVQQLAYYKKHPVNINEATTEELQLLQFLSDLQIANLLAYKKLLGNLTHLYELQAVPSWDLATIRKILPYVNVSDAISVKENFLSRFGGEHTLLLRYARVLEKAKGYDHSLNNHYLGDQNHLLLRYRYQYKDLLYYGIVGDKDPGEQFFKGAQATGFDFYSVHFFARRLGIIKALAIGDYTVNLGQGLIQWQSMGLSKSSEVMTIKRSAPVLSPYRAAGEANFNRGIGITLQKNNVEASFFGSYRKMSGNRATDSTDIFTSLLLSGLNRTMSELEDRNKITHAMLGSSINYQSNRLNIGCNTVYHQFNLPLRKKDEPYNYLLFEGRRMFHAGVDYSYTYKNVHLFGEGALDKNFHAAWISGALLSVDPAMDLSILYRYMQSSYASLFGNAFSENALPVNEKGLFMGVALRPVNAWQINAYADVYAFPWLRYRVNAPSSGHDYMLQANYQPNKQFELYIRYKNKNKPLNSAGNQPIPYPVDMIRKSLRVHFSQQVTRLWSVRSRMEMVWLKDSADRKEEGFLFYIEAIGQLRAGLKMNARLQYFETGGYDTRIYAYEADVLYAFSIPASFDKGFRYYINLNMSRGQCSVWIRWSQTIKKNGVNGSGLDLINGPAKSEVKCQLLISF